MVFLKCGDVGTRVGRFRSSKILPSYTFGDGRSTCVASSAEPIGAGAWNNFGGGVKTIRHMVSRSSIAWVLVCVLE